MQARSVLWGLAWGVILTAQGIMAQTREVSVPFLRAAVGSLQDRATIKIEAVYSPEAGLVEANRRYLRGKGISRFSIRDTQSSGTFTSMYCAQDGKAFKELVALQEAKRVHLSGYKDYGEDNEAAIFVTGVEVLADPVKTITATGENTGGTFRVTLKNAASGTTTILANAMPGKTYQIDGMTLVIESEDTPSTRTGEVPESP